MRDGWHHAARAPRRAGLPAAAHPGGPAPASWHRWAGAAGPATLRGRLACGPGGPGWPAGPPGPGTGLRYGHSAATLPHVQPCTLLRTPSPPPPQPSQGAVALNGDPRHRLGRAAGSPPHPAPHKQPPPLGFALTGTRNSRSPWWPGWGMQEAKAGRGRTRPRAQGWGLGSGADELWLRKGEGLAGELRLRKSLDKWSECCGGLDGGPELGGPL